MIEFKGYITGEAEKRFVRKRRNGTLFMCAWLLLLSLPMVYFTGKLVFRDAAFSHIVYGGFVLFCVILLLPKRKHEHLASLPQRIYTDGDFIVCVTEERTESRHIHDAKKVIDHEEYYELIFGRGKQSDMFICQKDLLTRGTLRGFEKLFDCQIIKINEEEKT